jgi:hypothetical protein
MRFRNKNIYKKLFVKFDMAFMLNHTSSSVDSKLVGSSKYRNIFIFLNKYFIQILKKLLMLPAKRVGVEFKEASTSFFRLVFLNKEI